MGLGTEPAAAAEPAPEPAAEPAAEPVAVAEPPSADIFASTKRIEPPAPPPKPILPKAGLQVLEPKVAVQQPSAQLASPYQQYLAVHQSYMAALASEGVGS